MRKVPFSTIQKSIIALVFASGLFQGLSIVSKTLPDIQEFIRAKGNYIRLKEGYPAFRTAMEAKRLIPNSMPVSLNYQKHSLEVLAVEYTLYPLRVVPGKHYIIDIDGSMPRPPPSWRSRQLSTGAVVYAQPGYAFARHSEPRPMLPLFTKIILFLLTVLFYWGTGAALFTCRRGHCSKNQIVRTAPLNYLLGVITYTAAVWVFLLAGLKLDNITLIAAGIPLLFLAWLIRRQRNTFPIMAVENNTLPTRAERLWKLLFFLTAAWIILTNISVPVRYWDTMTVWLNKAQIIAHQRNLDLSLTFNKNNFYPVLWPIHMAVHYCLQSGAYDELAKWASASALICFFMFLYQSLRLLDIPEKMSWIALTAFVAFFYCENPMVSALPENIFLAVLAGLIACLLLLLRHPSSAILKIIIGVLCLGINLIKLEGGFVTFFILLAVLCSKAVPVNGKLFRTLVIPISLTILFPILWVLWIRHTGLSPSVSHFQSPLSWAKLGLILQQGAAHALQMGELAVFLLMILTLRFFPNKRPWHAGERFLLVLTAGLVAFRWFAFVGWSEPSILNKGLFPDGCIRLFLHAAPSLFLLWSSRLLHPSSLNT